MSSLPAVEAHFTQRVPIHHIGFTVADMSDGMSHWIDTYGAGPFYMFGRVPFDSVVSGGREAIFDHSASFAQCGPIAVELQELYKVDPPRLGTLISAGRQQGINHVAYAVADPEAESQRLEQLGFPAYLDARVGDIHVIWHDTVDRLGYSVELHQAGPALDELFNTLASTAVDWTGDDPVRSFF